MSFRTFLPDRLLESGRIFRDIRGLERVYETKGSDPGPDQIRGDMGIVLVHDLQASMSTQLAEVDALSVTAAPAGASTTATATVSFPTFPDGRPSARHRVLSALCVISGATAANFDGAVLRMQPFGDPTAANVAFVDPTTVVAIPAVQTVALLTPSINGLWMRGDVDYQWNVRSNAGGVTSASLQLLVAQVPDGVAVPG